MSKFCRASESHWETLLSLLQFGLSVCCYYRPAGHIPSSHSVVLVHLLLLSASGCHERCLEMGDLIPLPENPYSLSLS